MDQFKDFQRYVKGVDPYGMQSGIVLIDPPEEWYVTYLPTLLVTNTKAAHNLSWTG